MDQTREDRDVCLTMMEGTGIGHVTPVLECSETWPAASLKLNKGACVAEQTRLCVLAGWAGERGPNVEISSRCYRVGNPPRSYHTRPKTKGQSLLTRTTAIWKDREDRGQKSV